MTKPSPDLTPAEFNVMKVLWHLRRGTVAEVGSTLAGSGWRSAGAPAAMGFGASTIA